VSTVERISVLKSVYGQEVELIGEDGQTELLRIAAEFRVGGSDYAGLQSESMRKSDEVAFFRIISGGPEPVLESIEDEAEWEAAAEAYDDLWFDGDQQP